MSEPAAATPPPEPPAARDALLRQIVDELRAGNALVRAVIAGQGAQYELTAHDARLADFQADLRTFARRQAVDEVEAATQPVPELEPARNRHRAPRQRTTGQQRALRAVRDVGPIGAVVAAFRPLGTALKHSWAAHPVATAATGFTAATLATAAVVAPHAGVTLPFGAGTSTSNPPASVYSATPISVSGPLPSRVALALTKPKPDAATSAPLSTLPPVSSPVQGPGDGQAPAPEPSSQEAAPQVQLVVSHALSLGLQSSGTIRITAFGAGTDWTAQTSDGGMMLDQASGSLNAGGSITIRVSITADLQALTGPGSVTIDYGNGKSVSVPVSWTLIPLPLPSPTDTSLPVDLPTLPAILGS